VAAARIVQVKPGKGRAPVLHHANRAAIGELGPYLIVEGEGYPQPRHRSIDDHLHIVEDESSVDAYVQLGGFEDHRGRKTLHARVGGDDGALKRRGSIVWLLPIRAWGLRAPDGTVRARLRGPIN
jgi:hypothetical protein